MNMKLCKAQVLNIFLVYFILHGIQFFNLLEIDTVVTYSYNY